MSPPRRFWFGLLSLALLAGFLRGWVLWSAEPIALVGDETYYTEMAVRLGLGQEHCSKVRQSCAGWPPGQPYVLSWFLTDPTSGKVSLQEAAKTFRLVESGWGTLLVMLVGILGCTLFDHRTGLLAAAFATVSPTFISFSHALWAETTFACLLLGAWILVVQGSRRRCWWLAIPAGLLFGASALTREIGLPLAGAAALWWAIRSSGPRLERWCTAGVLLACTVLTIAPWTIRNWQRFHRLVPISTAGWMGMREGNTLGDDWRTPDVAALRAFRQRHLAIKDELQRMDQARAEALELIEQEQPWWIVKKVLRNSALLFSPDSFLFKRVSRGAYGELSLTTIRALLIATLIWYLGVGLLGLRGAAAAAPDHRYFLLLAFLVVTGLHIVAQATSRYRFPLMPLVTIFAAWGVIHWRSSERLSCGARWGTAILAGVFLLWCAPAFFDDAVSLWNVGTYVDPQRP